MGLNIKNETVERLAAEVAALTRESKTEAIRRALEERMVRLELHRAAPSGCERLEIALRERIWPAIPKSASGRRISKRERERILGYGRSGV